MKYYYTFSLFVVFMSGYEALAGFLRSVICNNNCLGLSDDEIAGMSLEVAKSRTKKEVFDWCGTLLLAEDVAAEIIKRRHESGIRFDDDDPAALPGEKKSRQISVKGKRGMGPKSTKKSSTQHSEMTAGLVKLGEHECGCFATAHKLRANCLNCGRIICEQEGVDSCYHCGLDPSRCVAYEIAIQEGKVNEAAQAKNAALYADAIERRDRLLEYAKNKAKRTAVIDDQQATLFSPQNAWISPEERVKQERDLAAEERKKKIEEMHRHTGAYTVHLDFVNKNVTLGALPVAEERKQPVTTTNAEAEEEEEEGMRAVVDARAAPSPSVLQQIWYTEENSNGGDNGKPAEGKNCASRAPQSTANRKVLLVTSKRVQQDYFEDDNTAFEEGIVNRLRREENVTVEAEDYADPPSSSAAEASSSFSPAAEPNKESDVENELAMIPYAMRSRDDGVCLSMHQPWASLLVHGIKTHEGRGWTTPYRGKLWIHAASQPPMDIEQIEAQYASFVPQGKTFPAHYPTKVLVGYVFVTDCLSREEYEARFPPEERQEECEFSFICHCAVALPFPLPMTGNHKLFSLEHRIHTAAKKQLGEIDM